MCFSILESKDRATLFMNSMSYQAAMRVPLLSFEQERAAIGGWQDRGDRKALELLVCAHARQAWALAARFTDNPTHLEDLAAEGMMGLLRAADSFDRSQDVRFSTYASWWVRNAISAAVARIKAVIDIPARTYLDARAGRLPEPEHHLIRLAVQAAIEIDGASDGPAARSLLMPNCSATTRTNSRPTFSDTFTAGTFSDRFNASASVTTP